MEISDAHEVIVPVRATQKYKHPDGLDKPVVITFWNAPLGHYNKLTIRYNKRAILEPFEVSYESFRTTPYRTPLIRVQPVRHFSTLTSALESVQNYVCNWATEV